MSALDLTEAVDAAARAAYDDRAPDVFDDLDPGIKHHVREYVLPLVAAAAQVIEAAVRESIATELAATARQYNATYHRMNDAVIARDPRTFTTDDVIRYGAYTSAWETAARIARGDS